MTTRRVGTGRGSLPILQITVSFRKQCHAPDCQFWDVVNAPPLNSALGFRQWPCSKTARQQPDSLG